MCIILLCNASPKGKVRHMAHYLFIGQCPYSVWKMGFIMSTGGIFAWWGNGLILASGWGNIKRPEEEVEAKELCAGLHQTRILIQVYLESRNRDKRNREPRVMLRWKTEAGPGVNYMFCWKPSRDRQSFYSRLMKCREKKEVYLKSMEIYNIAS